MVAGAGLALWGSAHLGRNLTPFPRPVVGGRLVTNGAYGFARHPLYSGVILLALGFALFTTSPLRLALAGGLAVFLDAKSRREERWLLEVYPEYAAYRRRVKKFLPGIY